MPQSQLNSLPNYPVPLTQGRVTDSSWYRFWAGLFQGLPPQNEVVVTLGASPASYSAARKGSLIVSGGTVSLIEFTRNGTDYYDTGVLAGMFTLNASDVLRITYAAAPDAVFVPT